MAGRDGHADAHADTRGVSHSLDRLVEVMDRLRSPGGCPWDARQTHASLVPYLLEESHELAEAVDAGDRSGMREELGDVLLQVVFHARVASEHPDDPFDLDDVADVLVDKLVGRHPHVFADAPVEGDLHAQWDRLKRAEKPDRASALDGVPVGLPALARAAALAQRARRAGIDPAADDPVADDPVDVGAADDETAVGRALLELVLAHPGVDAEGALRRATRDWQTHVRRRESAG